MALIPRTLTVPPPHFLRYRGTEIPNFLGAILVSLPRLAIQLGITSEQMYIKFLPKVRGTDA